VPWPDTGLGSRPPLRSLSAAPADNLDGPLLVVGSSGGSACLGGPPGGPDEGRTVDLGSRDGFFIEEAGLTWIGDVSHGQDYVAFVVARGVPEAELIAADTTMRFDRETGPNLPRSARTPYRRVWRPWWSKEPTGEDAGGPPDSLVVSAVQGDLRWIFAVGTLPDYPDLGPVGQLTLAGGGLDSGCSAGSTRPLGRRPAVRRDRTGRRTVLNRLVTVPR